MLKTIVKPLCLSLALIGFGSSYASAGVCLMCGDTGSPRSPNLSVVSEGVGQLTILPMPVDASPSGMTVIPKHVKIESFLVSITNPTCLPQTPYNVSAIFNGPILGIQTSPKNLLIGLVLLVFEPDFDPAIPFGALERSDTASINGNLLTVTGKVGKHGVDATRVFVQAAAVPEFASIVVWSTTAGIGMVTLSRLRRRRRSA